MQLERRPLDRLRSQERAIEARRQALTDLRAKLQALADAAASLRSSSLWADVQAVASSDPSRLQATRIGGAAPGAYTVEITALASADQVRQAAGGATQASTDGVLDITVDGSSVSVAISAGDDLDTIAAKINAASGSPVYATVAGGRLYLSGKETGATKTISVASSSVADELGLSDTVRSASDHTIVAADASFTVNGVAFTSASNTVTSAVPGLSLVLKATTGGSPVTVTVGAPEPDREAVKAAVQTFVERYNALLSFVQSKLGERRSAGDPTKGVLAGDSGLVSLLARLRQAVADPLSPAPGTFSSLAEVGISTGAPTGSGSLDADAVSGRLVLDTAALDRALSASLADVKALFAEVTGSYDSEGLSLRLDRLLDPWLSGDGSSQPIVQARLDGDQAVLDSLASRRAELERRLSEREKALRAQFAALETILQQAQSQGAWLSAQLAQLTGGR